MNKNTSGKTLFVTGSNGGIGRAILECFASNGYSIFAHSRSDNSEFNMYLESLAQNYDVQISPIIFDMNDTAAMKEAVSELYKKKENIDVLINNSGVAHGGLFQMTKVDTVRDVFNVNLFSHMELTQLILKIMKRNHAGVIINMASISGLDLKAGNSAYGVSKAAMIAWTKTLAAEVTSQGIRVNAIAPGLTDTRMATQMEQQAGESMIRDSAMNRLAHPKEIADVALFLASEKASFVNGQVLRVDGGSK